MVDISVWLLGHSRGQSSSLQSMEKIWFLLCNYDGIKQTSSTWSIKWYIPTTYRSSFTYGNVGSRFPEELDSFRNVTYESEAEESKWDVEGDWDRKLENDSENNSDNGGSNDDNDFDYNTSSAFDAFEDM